ncbi:MAG: formate dehydrogenase accessory sulfurtransferase FdhD [Syntrophorhabdaceae bacterium]|nr:formate dehydrogenase accessory sulfurtransferase FdhD [Syntrophorhabdaceae bacterium]
MEEFPWVAKINILKFLNGERIETEDVVIREEPLEIFIDGEQFFLTMRMPGEEIPLALGLCFSEGIIESIDDVMGINYCGDMNQNRVNMYLKGEVSGKNRQDSLKRRFPVYSSCAICGSDIIDGVSRDIKRIEERIRIDIRNLISFQKTLLEKQEVFPLTGGTHAAGIFTPTGSLLAFSEDVGRHNALDKAIGKVLLNKKRVEAGIIVLSSRISFEMAQKAARFGVEILCGVSPPTSLAIELARRSNLTIVGFLRNHRGNVYTCPERIIIPS